MNHHTYNNMLDSGVARGLLQKSCGRYCVAETTMGKRKAQDLAKLIYRMTDWAQGTNVILEDRFGYPVWYRMDEYGCAITTGDMNDD